MIRLLFLLLFFTASQIYAQSLGEATAEPDENYFKVKQAKRQADLKGNRHAAGHPNMDWARWQAWQALNSEMKSSVQPSPWQNLGPDTISGRIIGLAFHPSDSNEMLVGAASGGLWRTRDYGNSWECLTDDYPTMGVGAVAYNPQNPSTILIATGEGYGFGGEFTSGFGIMISYNSGVTWQMTSLTANLSNSFAGMDLVWHEGDTNIVNVATSYSVYRSTDGGLNWTASLAKLPARMKADPQNSDRIYLTTRYLNATYPGGFFVSDDAGLTWTQMSSGLPPDNEFGYASLHIHEQYTNQIYMVVGQSTVLGSGPMRGLYKSSDYGLNFMQIPTNVDLMCYHPPYQSICQAWFGNTIAVSPTDTNMLFCGGTRFRRSMDGGLTWITSDINQGSSYYDLHPDHHQTQFHPITGDLVDCHDGGVGISNDHAITWISKSDGLITHQFYDIAVSQTNPETVIGGTQDVGAFTVKDVSAGSWRNPVGGDAFGTAIDPANADIWYITDLNYGRQKTVNAGNNWTQINSGTSQSHQWRSPIEIHPNNPSQLFSSEDLSTYRSDNAGALWAARSGYGPIQAFAFDAVDSNLIYASKLWDNEVYRSTDGGLSWLTTNSPLGSPITELVAHPNQNEVLFATIGSFAGSNQLYRSDDAGNSWYAISFGLPAVPMHSLAIDPFDPRVMYIGGDLGVWVTQNGGLSWSAYNDGLPPVVVEDIEYTALDTALHIGTYGRGYWKTSALPPPSIISSLDAVGNTHQFSMRPNPSNGWVKLQSTQQMATIRVYNLQGALVFEKNIDGTYTEFSTNDWAAGAYLVHCNTDKQSSRQLLVVVK